MAKSLRSSKQQRNKIVKRQTVFGEAAALRENRIAEKLHNAAIDQILANQEITNPDRKESPSAKQEETMEVEASTDTAAPPAVSSRKSTGGWGRKRKTRAKKSKKSKK